MNHLQMEFANVRVMCIADESHNRMRIIAPVKKAEDLTREEKDKNITIQFSFRLSAGAGRLVNTVLLFWNRATNLNF